MSEPSNPKPGGARRDDAQRNDDADPRADDVLAAYRAANAAMRAAGAPAAAAQAQAAGANETHDGVRPLGARVTPPPERDGEAPRAQTRAAILAAAARAVDARPRAVRRDTAPARTGGQRPRDAGCAVGVDIAARKRTDTCGVGCNRRRRIGRGCRPLGNGRGFACARNRTERTRWCSQ